MADNELKNGDGSETVYATPTKLFFVTMLTRDIALQDAILDLLDNCVDGVIRSTPPAQPENEKPYSGYWAKIDFDKDMLKISDNCGGIPKDVAINYAFRMGNPKPDRDGDRATVGMYGIGMKRAFFKMGRQIKVTSQTKEDRFQVTISPEWLNDDGAWELPLVSAARESGSENGTTIEIRELHSSVGKEFSSEGSAFYELFAQAVAQHYSFILHKGFEVHVNGNVIEPKPLHLLWSEPDHAENGGIAPYMYVGHRDGVDVELAVGFYRPTPDESELEDEQKMRHSREEAGWTIICNDRVVAYCDKSRVTGWGEADVPSYHNQFIAIAGIVHFRSKDARKLPMTTTKRGVDASSDTYLYVKNFMREGMKKFTTYTNKWKSYGEEEKKISSQAASVNVSALIAKAPLSAWKPVKGNATERKFEPSLPVPSKADNNVRQIRFSRSLADIRRVAEYLFEDDSISPADVGGECFDRALNQAKSGKGTAK